MPASDDTKAVLTANRDFYRAFESLDPERMGAVWLRENWVTCTHPGWARILGWPAVIKSWEDIFAGVFGVKIEIVDEIAQVRADVAWVTCVEQLEQRVPDGVSYGRVAAVNLFERRDGRWLLVHHHGSPLSRGHDPDDDVQLH